MMRYMRFSVLLAFIVLICTFYLYGQSNSSPEYAPDIVLVKFKPGTAKSKKKDATDSVNATTEKEYHIVPGLQKITTNLGVEKAIQILSKNLNVEYAEPDFVVSIDIIPNDPLFGDLWGMNQAMMSISMHQKHGIIILVTPTLLLLT